MFLNSTTDDNSRIYKVYEDAEIIRRAKRIVYEKYRGIDLKENGRKMGEYALTRHELLEDFLRIIGVQEDKIYEEVEGIEHHFGKNSLEKIKELIKYLWQTKNT